MTGDLRIGFIGCGLIARSHAGGLAQAPNATITAVHDQDPERASAFAAEFSPLRSEAVHPTAESVISSVDALYVCTWTDSHPELVAAAASAGLPVFCEKPLARTLDEAMAMTEVVAKAGVVNQVGLVLRYSPAFRLLRDLVNEPETGPIMNIVFRDDQYIPTQGMYRSTWRGDYSKAGGGALLEHSIHDLDLLEWLMGPVADVSARTGTVHGLAGIDDQATVTLVSDRGTQASLVSVWHDVLTRPSQRRVEVFTLKGYYCLEGDWNGPISYDIAETETETESRPARAGRYEGRKLLAECKRRGLDGYQPDAEFVDAALANRAAHPDFETALAAHRLADAAYRSAASGGTTIATPPLLIQ